VAPRDFVKQSQLSWAHGHLGSGYQTPVPGKYGTASGTASVPTFFLIGPDGKIVAVASDVNAAAQAVEEVLSGK
jgi:hypothetical protein